MIQRDTAVERRERGGERERERGEEGERERGGDRETKGKAGGEEQGRTETGSETVKVRSYKAQYPNLSNCPKHLTSSLPSAIGMTSRMTDLTIKSWKAVGCGSGRGPATTTRTSLTA